MGDNDRQLTMGKETVAHTDEPVVAVDGLPASGKSTLSRELASNCRRCQPIDEFELEEPSGPLFPETASQLRAFSTDEYERERLRREAVGNERPLVLDISVVSTVGLITLYDQIFESCVALDLIDMYRQAGVNGEIILPTHVVYQTCDAETIQSRWADRSSHVPFWEEPALVKYFNGYITALAEEIPVAVYDSSNQVPAEIASEASNHVATTPAIDRTDLLDGLEAVLNQLPSVSLEPLRVHLTG